MNVDGLVKKGMSPEEAAKVAGVGRTLIFNEIRKGRLVARKCGRRTLIINDDLDAWLSGLPTAVKPALA